MKKRSLTSYKKKAWSLCSEYVRRQSADPDGNVVCVCCGVRKHWKQMQAGHLVPSRRLGILFDQRGIKPCCYGCNIMKGGNIHEYVAYMKENFGKEYTENLIDELRLNARKAIKFTSTDYEGLITIFTEKLRGLK